MTIATDMLALYIEAEKAVLLGKEVQMGDRKLSRADLDEIRKGRREWQKAVNSEQNPPADGFGGLSVSHANLSKLS